MQICQSCQKAAGCRIPTDFARFQRVYDHLRSYGGPETLRQRLEVFLHINHCIAEGELDLIHHMVDEHLNDDLPPGTHVNQWGIPDEGRDKMIALRRAMA